MRCKTVQKLLSPYMDGELPARQKNLVEGHLGLCPVCRQEWEKLRRLEAMQKAGPDLEPSPQYWEDFLPRLRQKMAAASRPSLMQRLCNWMSSPVPARWLKTAGAVAAVVLVLVIGRAVRRDSGIDHTAPFQQTESPGKRGKTFPGKMPAEQKTREKASLNEADESAPPDEKLSGVRQEAQSGPQDAGTASPLPPVVTDTSQEISAVPRSDETQKLRSLAGEHAAGRPMAVAIDGGLLAYKDAMRKQQQGEQDSAAIRFLEVVHAYPRSPVADNAQYQINLMDNTAAEKTQDPDSWRQQRDAWQNFMQTYPRSELADDACLKLADSWYHLAVLEAKPEYLTQALAANRRCAGAHRTNEALQHQARELEDLINRQRK